jgi:hypothetical protein
MKNHFSMNLIAKTGIISLILIFTIGCNKESMINYDEFEYETQSFSMPAVQNMGFLHNLVLQQIMQDTTYNLDSLSERERYLQDVVSILSGLNSQYDSTTGYQESYDLVVNYFLPNTTVSSIDTLYNQHYTNKAVYLPNEEHQLVEDVFNYLTNTDFSGLTNLQIFNAIKSEANDFLTDYNSIDWETIGTSNQIAGEAAGGLIYVLLGTADFWDNNDELGDMDPQAILKIDAFGFLIGWGFAVGEEIHRTGGLSRDNSTRRLWAGLGGSCTASFFGTVKISAK